MKTRITLLLLLLSFFSSHVFATELIFNVPVKLNRIMKGIPQARVTCDVFNYSDNINPIASGYTSFGINSQQGFLNKNVNVIANFLPQQRHKTPHQYHCFLELLLPWASPPWQQPGKNAQLQALQPRKKSRLVTEVSGIIESN